MQPKKIFKLSGRFPVKHISSDEFLFCSTLEERAQRLFSTKGKRMEDMDPSMFAKSKPGKAGKSR